MDDRSRKKEPARNRSPRDLHRPEALGDLLPAFLQQQGLSERVAQNSVIPEWHTLVGDTIAQHTEPLHVTADGTLFIAVRTHAWMTELQLMTPQLLGKLNHDPGRPPIRKLRFRLMEPKAGSKGA